MTTPSPFQGGPVPAAPVQGSPMQGGPVQANPVPASPVDGTATGALHPLVPPAIIATGILLLAGIWMTFELRFAVHLNRPWTWFYDAPSWLVSPLGFGGFGLAIVFGLLGGVPLGLFLGRASQHPGWAVLGPVGAVLAWPALLSLRMTHQWWVTTQRFSGFSSFIDRMVRPSDLWAPLVLVVVTGVVAVAARLTRTS